MRFLLGSLSDFDDLKHTVTDWNALEPVDQWAMVRLWHLLVDVERAYDEYKFHMVYRAVYDYIVGDLSAEMCIRDSLHAEALLHLLGHVLGLLEAVAVGDEHHLLVDGLDGALLHVVHERVQRLLAAAHLLERDEMPLVVHVHDRLEMCIRDRYTWSSDSE